jgi:hypothetical protein
MNYPKGSGLSSDIEENGTCERKHPLHGSIDEIILNRMIAPNLTITPDQVQKNTKIFHYQDVRSSMLNYFLHYKKDSI